MRTAQLEVAGARSNETRAAIAAWRKALAQREIGLESLLREAPACFADWSLLEVMRLGYRWGRRRLAELNGYAVECGINLATPWRDASPRAVEFCIAAAETSGHHHLHNVRQGRWVREFKPEGVLRAAVRVLDRAIARHERQVKAREFEPSDIDRELWAARARIRSRG